MRPLLLLAALCSLSAEAQTPLRLGVPVSDSLGVRGEHVYTVRLGAGQFVAGDAEAPGADLLLRVVGPDGSAVDTFDTGFRGREPFQFTTRRAGTYRIIAALPFRDETGRYTLTLRLAEPVATDRAGRIRQAAPGLSGPGQPAVILSVVERGRTTSSLAMGRADVDADTPATEETRFDIGRIATTMTSAALLTLADAGRLDLDADLATLLPDLPTPTGPLTVRDLLDGRTGYLDVATVAALRDPALGVLRGQAAVDTTLAVQQRLEARAGRDTGRRRSASRRYGAGGQTDRMVTARVVETVTGQPFGAWMQAHLFRPLGMSRTAVRADPETRVPGLATTYARPGEGLSVSQRTDGPPSAWNAVYSTAPDMARWMAALAGPTAANLLGRIAEAPQAGVVQYGLYTERVRDDGFRVSAADYTSGGVEMKYDSGLRAGYVLFTGRPGISYGLLDALLGIFGESALALGPAVARFHPEGMTDARAARLDSLLGGRYVAAEVAAEITVDVSAAGGVGVRDYGGPRHVAKERRGYRYEAPAPVGEFEFDRSGDDPVPTLVLRGPGRDGIRFARSAE